MNIAGLQKMTLLDYPGKVACTVFLAGCNFHCPFCHNSQLIGQIQPVMTEQALLTFLRKRQGLLEGVCVTGGEPTLSPELPRLLAQIKALGFAVKLDTNGTNPEMLKTLVNQGLVDYVAMDLKNSPGNYPRTCGRPALDLGPVEESIRFLLEGRVAYEFRTTVVKPLHDAAAVTDLGGWLLSFGRAKQLFLQCFVDRDTVPVSGLSAPNREEMAFFADILSPCADKIEIRGMD